MDKKVMTLPDSDDMRFRWGGGEHEDCLLAFGEAAYDVWQP